MATTRAAPASKSNRQEEEDDTSYVFDDVTPLQPLTKDDGSTTGRISVGPIRPRPLNMKFMTSLSGLCCQECGTDPILSIEDLPDNDAPSELHNLQLLKRSGSSISPLVVAPMTTNPPTTVEGIIGEYMTLCQFYKIPYNAGVLTTLRFSLPSLRVTGSFHDLDMLALTELLLRHANSPRLRHVRRLDFTMASREGKQNTTYKLGFTSHGALALAKTLQTTRYIQQVWLPRHRIGPYGASALFLACKDNTTIQSLNLHRCRIGERGAFAICEVISSGATGLIDVNLSSNGIGHKGTVAINLALEERAKVVKETAVPLIFNLEGNLVIPEIMNGVTHGLGVILSLVGAGLLSKRIDGQSLTHQISCAVYSFSLFALYLSSTLFHSFFALLRAKHFFQVMDKCAIYILIAGSYTPFLSVIMNDRLEYSVGMLGFIWTCGLLGICVEAFAPGWKWRPWFSLSMYLGMGWAALICLPVANQRLAPGAGDLIVLGGVGYTVGVPFFLRNNNLDHAIWHLFVMAGSIFHWLSVYLYIAPTRLPIQSTVL